MATTAVCLSDEQARSRSKSPDYSNGNVTGKDPLETAIEEVQQLKAKYKKDRYYYEDLKVIKKNVKLIFAKVTYDSEVVLKILGKNESSS